MQQKRIKELNIVEPINDNILLPNISLGRFVFGNNIKLYLNDFSYKYEENPDKKKGYGYDSYYFDKLKIEVWTDESGIIESVRCEHACYWKSVNIIGLRYEKFKAMCHMEPDVQDLCYMYDGKTQHVYDFESMGLQLWVRYGIIRTVIACRLLDE